MRYFVLIFLFSSLALSKNKILFIEKVTDLKTPPNLYVIGDFKKPNSKKLLESAVDSYSSGADYIVYMKSGSLFIITDFETYNKILVSDSVSGYRIKEGMLFYTKIQNNNVTLYAISDFKSLIKQEVISNFSSYSIDDY